MNHSSASAAEGSGTCSLASGREREPYVLVRELDVEPGLVGEVEDERSAAVQERRPDRASGHHVDRQLAGDAAALGEQNALAEGEHLRGEADVDSRA